MSENIDNTPEKKKRKKIILLVLLLSLLFIMITGILIAFFSDLIWKKADITSGTLKINGTYTFFLNETESGDTITNFKPGDAVVIRANITNTGNLSAWIREVVSLDPGNEDILPYIRIYTGEHSQNDLAGNLDEFLLTLTGEGSAAGATKVINGTGGQTESGGDYTYIGSNTYQTAYTVYFLPTATNDAQAQNFGLNVTTQALQFRNNNAAEPTEIAWATVAPATT